MKPAADIVGGCCVNLVIPRTGSRFVTTMSAALFELNL